MPERSTMTDETTTTDIAAPLLSLLSVLTVSLQSLERTFHRLPGSPILVRYIKSSYQDDPWRSALELFLVAFAVRTLLKGRTRGEGEGKNWVKLSEKEIDELVDEFTPAPMIDAPVNHLETALLPSLPVIQGPTGAKVKILASGKTVTNLASPNWTGLLESEAIKANAVETLRTYGVGTCGPPGFYGTMDVHNQLEKDISNFLGTQSTIIYSQSFSTISSVIPAFAKRGDVIVADRGANFAIQKGVQISRCAVKWYAHNDMADLERVLIAVERDHRRKGGKVGRRFIVTEGVFENDGALLNLPRVMELKKRFKFRLILDESQSVGMIGKHGRGLTEHYGCSPDDVDILVGSMATGFASGGGFCSGSSVVVDHQRINGSAFVFSAALPALLATAASTSISILSSQPNLITTLQSNISIMRASLSRLEQANEGPTNADAIIDVPSDPASALIHIFLLHPPETLELEEKLLQDVVDEAVANGLLVTRSRRLRGQETFEPEPSLKVCVTSALNKKDMEKAASVLRHALIKVVGSEF